MLLFVWKYICQENITFDCNRIYVTHQISLRIIFHVHMTLLRHEKCVSVKIRLRCGISSQTGRYTIRWHYFFSRVPWSFNGQPVPSIEPLLRVEKERIVWTPSNFCHLNSLTRKTSSLFNSKFPVIFYKRKLVW